MKKLGRILKFIRIIKKKKIFLIEKNDSEFFLFFLKNTLKKNFLFGKKKENKFFEIIPKSSEIIFFSGAFHLKIYIKKNFQSNLLSHDLFKNLGQNNRFSKKKTEKLVIIFDGIENLSQPAQFQIFSLMKKSDRNLKFIILTRKNRPILKIFQKFFLPPILKNSSVKMISKKIREKFFFRKNTKKYKKEKKLLSQVFGLNFFISKKNVSRIFSFFFFSPKNKKLSKIIINKSTLFKNFYQSFSFNFLKIILHRESNSMNKNIQISHFYFYRLFLAKNQYFFY